MTPLTLYGFDRTTCVCEMCTALCRRVSGMVTPADLTRWQIEHGAQFWGWALAHLAASPGALVLRGGATERIPTIVPARHASGSGVCVFLDGRERCEIHQTAPYGCRHFDCTMSAADGHVRTRPALADIAYAWATQGLYALLWAQLHAAGCTVNAPEVARGHAADA